MNNMKFIKADASLIKWLLDKLKNDPPESPKTAEFISGIAELSEGKADSLSISLTDRTDTQPEIQAGDIFTGGLRISLKSRRVLLDGREISLTPKEFDILYFLAENRGEVFTKEQIYKAVWSDNYLLDDSNIMAFIRKLRKKIEPDPDAPKYIITIWGIGYKFNDRL